MKIKFTVLALLAIGIFCFTNQILAADPVTNEVLALTAKGKDAFEQKNFDLALGCYSKVLQLDSNNANAYYVRGWIQDWKGNYDDAINDLSKCIYLSTNSFSLSYMFLSRGCAFFSKNKQEQAIDDLSKAIQLNPKLAEAYGARARAYNFTKQFSGAIIDCNMSILLNPNFADTYCERGFANEQNGDLDKAVADLDKAIQLAPTNDVFYVTRARILANKGDTTRAIADEDKAIGLNQKNVDAFSGRGLLHSRTGEYGKGIEDCRTAVLLDKNDTIANNNLAWLLTITPDTKLRDGKKALEYAKRACELSEWKNAYCLGTLAAAYAETENYDEAVKWEKMCIATGLPEKEMQQARKELDLFENKKPYHAEN